VLSTDPPVDRRDGDVAPERFDRRGAHLRGDARRLETATSETPHREPRSAKPVGCTTSASAPKTILMHDSSRQNTMRAPQTRRAQIRRPRFVGECYCRSEQRHGKQREAPIAPNDWGQSFSRRTCHSPLPMISRTSTFVAVVPRSTLVQVSHSRVEREYRNQFFHTQ
jgi:hypothetical protein